LPLAIFAGVSEAVPTVGPAVTFVLALLLGATQGVAQVVGATVVYAVVQSLESYVLIPLVMRSAVNLPPVVTLFTIVLWGKIFGIAGLLLAVPIDLIIWGLLDHFVIRPHEPIRPP
jgi:predicted PurR-regulated permease PerM